MPSESVSPIATDLPNRPNFARPTALSAHFTDPKHPGSAVEEIKLASAAGEIYRAHSFELACAKYNVDHQ